MYNATYFQRHLQHYPEKIAGLGEFQVMLDNEKDYIATRTANRLNLQGPAISVHTACSTSLVANCPRPCWPCGRASARWRWPAVWP